ncbi:hypothetical protein GCM10007103_35150 [Salinimicrobium marinum]|uniref:RES domain-containing protein n=1 Tax=Salinimicrobium marinum TaxID=680283 RepID=A0A918SL58_9FLAO|nr:hypothetical protein [Salinimicrobium marinum]GHA51652.1 hypothetical protein GCM10007103_35150 [Salinimicrobium marinum]
MIEILSEGHRIGTGKAQFTTIYKNNAQTCLESKHLAYLLRLIFLRKIIAGNRRTVFIRDVGTHFKENTNMKENFISHSKQLLRKIKTVDLIKKIEEFRNTDTKRIKDEELFKEISKTISVNVNGQEEAILFPRIAKYPKKTRFYRVRKVENEDHFIPLKAMTFESDAWNPPEKFITRRGRLNNVNESLLYTSPGDPSVAVEELKIQDDERFCLIVYEATEEVKVSMIGLWEDIPELNEEENLKMRIINNFLRDEFTRDVGEGTEFLYRVSERITKDYFDLPPKVVQDAWCYPSIAKKQSVNVCFRPDIAKNLLELVGVQICKVQKEKNGYLFNCNAIASGFDSNGKFIYHSIDSEHCRKIFPEIMIG